MTPHSVSLLERLVAFPTISSESNLALIEWIADYLDRYGVGVRLTHDDAGGKANLFATIGEGSGGIVLSGHTDVVPVAGQKWCSDPFVAHRRDGRIYGRGTCDMKGFIAVALSLVPDLVRREDKPPVHFALSYDEEIGCLGVRRLLADLETLPCKPHGCIVGEPTDMRVVVGHKGAGMYKFIVTGKAAHSSLAPFGVNAIEYATRIIGRFRAIAERLKANEERDPAYDVPYSTIQVNRISGGSAGNIVADSCEFMVDIRSLAWTDRDALLAEVDAFIAATLLPEMRHVEPLASISRQHIGDVPAFAIDETAPLVEEVLSKSRVHECGHVAFGSEAGLFQGAGIPSLICGPGSIEQAHRADEFVEIGQLAQCEEMLRSLLKIPTELA